MDVCHIKSSALNRVEKNNMTQWMLVSDLDDTLIGDDSSLQELANEILKQRERIILAYNSSRPCNSIRKSIDEYPELLELQPDYVIGALGTEIEIGLTGEPIPGYRQLLAKGWNRDQISSLVENIGLEPHAKEFQTPFKASYNINSYDEYALIKKILADHGYQAKMIFSGGKNLDIIPSNSGKGAAIEYLIEETCVKADRVVVCGDSANDIDMFTDSSKGIVVANADHELKDLKGPNIYHAQNSYAGGVLEGLYYWGVVTRDGYHPK
jgi:sucrose-6F-phosphate phosphohydrolase